MACAARNARQVRPDRRGVGSTPVSWRICHTVDGATLYPKLAQLSLDAPVVQAGLSRAISSINASIVGEVLDRPGVRRG